MDSVEFGRQARTLLEGRGDRWEVWALSYLARRCALLDNEAEARALIAEALPMAEAIGHLSAVSWLHDTLAVLGGTRPQSQRNGARRSRLIAKRATSPRS